MRLAVISDVHGNLPALEAVLADIDSQGIEELIMLGDFADRGPFPLEVVRLMMQRGGRMIRGNTDEQIVAVAQRKAPDEWLTSKQFSSMRWTASQLDAEAINFLSTLAGQLVVEFPGLSPIRVLHGSPNSSSGAIFPDREPHTLAEAFALVDEPIFLCGHTHRSWVAEQGGQMAVNPGSVGQPFNVDLRAQYAILTWDQNARRWRVDLKAIDYDRDRTRRAFKTSGYLDASPIFARACLLNFEAGLAEVAVFLRYFRQFAADAGYLDPANIPDELWDQAGATWDWDRRFAAARAETVPND